MGKVTTEKTHAERVQAAREKLERYRIEHGVPEFRIERLLECTYPSDESDEEFMQFLRELRTQGRSREL